MPGPNLIRYHCTNCGQPKERSELLARRVVYATIKPVKTVRSRVVGWWCEPCRRTDPAWTRPAHTSVGVEQQRKKDSE